MLKIIEDNIWKPFKVVPVSGTNGWYCVTLAAPGFQTIEMSEGFLEECQEECDELNSRLSALLASQNMTDGAAYNAGCSEGHADIKVDVRKIVDPEDSEHLNLDGVVKEVQRLVDYKKQAQWLIKLIYESSALKEFAYSNDDGPSISKLLRECYYQGEGYKDNLK